MGAASDWYNALDPTFRELIRAQVLCLAREPTEPQIAELPELIAPSWKLDAIGIASAQQPAVRAAIAELAAQLKAEKRAARAR